MKRLGLLVALSLPLVGAAPNATSVDDTFAVVATQGGNAEIAAARMALSRTSTDGVAAFARLMLTDHGAISREGEPLLRRHLARTPLALAPADAIAMRSLQDDAPVDFDQAYAMLQIADHLATRAAFAAEAREGSDPALREFAAKWLPTIDAHLQLAVILIKHVGGDTPFKR